MSETSLSISTDLALLQSAVDKLAHAPDEFRTLRPGPERIHAVRIAANRLQAAVARERGADQPVLTIAFAGCTGAGKSTLINSLARARITRVIGRAATTRQAHVYHHQGLKLAGLPQQLAQQAIMVTHDRPELFAKVLIDTPDLDTAVLTNRQTTKAILKAATLVLYVFTPDRYAEERVWSVIEQERRFSAFAAVLNKSDYVSPSELQRIKDDLRGLFAERGAADVRIFTTVGIKHQPDEAGEEPPPFNDDFDSLRTFIERELRQADIMRLARRQRRNATTSLRAAVDAVVPADAMERFEAAAKAGEETIADATSRLSSQWRPVFDAAEDAIVPAAKRRYHERFRGPLRGWFAIVDGLAMIGQRLAGNPSDALDLDTLRSSLDAGSKEVEDRLAAVSQRVQDKLHTDGLPVGRWTAITGGRTPGAQIVSDVATAVESACRAQATVSSPGREAMARLLSWISYGIVAVIVAIGLWRFSADLIGGTYQESGKLLLNIAGLICVSMFALQIVVMITGPGSRGGAIDVAGAAATRRAMENVLTGWLKSYRAELESDVADLRGPLNQIEQAFGKEDAALGLTDEQGTGIAPAAIEEKPATPPMELPAPPATVELSLPQNVTSEIGETTSPSPAVEEAKSPEPAAEQPAAEPSPAPRKNLSDYLKELKR
jgi:GTP-binding protein EngB required for normal cell division